MKGNFLTEFAYESKQVRVVQIEGNPWFVAKDIAEILEIQNFTMSLKLFPSNEIDELSITDTIGRKQKSIVLSEPGLYRMIFQSRKDEAENFKTWVFSEVLPSIRKTGSYSIFDKGLFSPITREESKKIRNSFTACLKEHGVNKPHHYINITRSHKKGLQIDTKKKKESYSEEELCLTGAAELITQFKIKKAELSGYSQINPVALKSAEGVRTIALEEVTQELLEAGV